MTEEVKRNYLEINSLQDLKEGYKPSEDYSLSLIDPVNFQLNKFFYKTIGKNHEWTDRLSWSEEKWIAYVSSKNVKVSSIPIGLLIQRQMSPSRCNSNKSG
mgnify:CR=1 FL=1